MLRCIAYTEYVMYTKTKLTSEHVANSTIFSMFFFLSVISFHFFSFHFYHLMENNCSRFILCITYICYYCHHHQVPVTHQSCLYVQYESVSVYDNRRKISVKKRRFVSIHHARCESASGVLSSLQYVRCDTATALLCSAPKQVLMWMRGISRSHVCLYRKADCACENKWIGCHLRFLLCCNGVIKSYVHSQWNGTYSPHSLPDGCKKKNKRIPLKRSLVWFSVCPNLIIMVHPLVWLLIQ